jgi:predicted amidohydrolase YtcJ
MCIICNPALAGAFRTLSFTSRREFLKGAGAVAAGPFIAEAVGPGAARADGSLNETFGAALPSRRAAEAPATIYTASKFITMERDNPQATAVAVAGKRILSVGSLAEVKAALGARPFVVDDTFRSKIVLPGLIDQHVHPILGSLTLAIEVIAPEDWVLPRGTFKAANGAAEYRVRLKAAEATLKDPNEWLLTWGYHALWHGKLDRATLDALSATRQVAVWHRSCHEFYLNTAALNALGLTEAMTKGKGHASEQVDWSEGHFYEDGLNLMAGPMLKVLATPERVSFGLKQMVAYLHSRGVTAYNEPGALYTPDMWRIYQQILGADETPMCPKVRRASLRRETTWRTQFARSHHGGDE